MMPAIRFVQKLTSPPRYWPEAAISTGFYESLGCDVVHFPTQKFTVCALPTVYNPIDLQHLHYPQFFLPLDLAAREATYRTGCNLAQAVIVNSEFIKGDLLRHYQVDPEKVVVIPEAPPTSFTPEPSEDLLQALRRKYEIGGPFVFYPAVTWPHKNHVRLVEALAHLRSLGLDLRLVCTGSRDDAFWPTLSARIQDLSMTSSVTFLGYVSQDEVRGLYRLATALVLPSLFEANSLPVFEAWLEGTPVACSNTTGLPEQVGDAALLFDPDDPVDIARALHDLASDSGLRAVLRAKGRQRLIEFTWERTAREYRDVYRWVARGRRGMVRHPPVGHPGPPPDATRSSTQPQRG
jgi:glycosyltransferase involved in cell wall biosynthesis